MLYDVPFPDGSPRMYRRAEKFIDSGINAIEVGYNCLPKCKKQLMQRNVYILHYITEGKGVFMDEEMDNTCGYVVVPGEVEKNEADSEEPYECYWIMFRGELSDVFLRKVGLDIHNSVFKFDKNRQCAEIIKKALFHELCNDSASEACVIQAAFYEIIALHMSGKSSELKPAAATAERIADFIKKNYHHQLRISEIAEKFHYTRNHLFALFKKEYGMSPQDYLLNYRLEKAKLLLSNQRHKLIIKEISDAVGFEDPLYFSRLFRKRVGMSPTEYKKRHKAELDL